MIYDVIIAGGGPVGLFLACELGLAGTSVLVLEKAQEPYSPLKRLPLGMRGITVPSAEAFYRRGLLEDVAGPHPIQNAGHFSGIDIDPDKIDYSRWSYRLPNPAFKNFGTEMERVESALAVRARVLGVQIRHGAEVTDFQETNDGVTVASNDEMFEGRWLVGCDGGRSRVRKIGAFEFAGTEPTFTGYSTVVDLADPEKLNTGRNLTSRGAYFLGPQGVLALVDFDGGAFHRTEEITLEHLQAVLKRVSDTNATISAIHLATTWTDRTQQATTYRKGRVLLAGDAAHIHSPLGGQGLNAGLGDAMNLGWKLASVTKGTAPQDLLDSYTAERHPIGDKVLDWSRAQVDLMRPSRHARAMESVISDLMQTSEGNTYFAERVWGVLTRYDLGGAHPLVGRSVPDFNFGGGSTVGTLMREGKGLLLDFNGSEELRACTREYRDQVKYVSGEATERLGLDAVLVRPDGFVAWACENECETANAAAAAARWFGQPPKAKTLK